MNNHYITTPKVIQTLVQTELSWLGHCHSVFLVLPSTAFLTSISLLIIFYIPMHTHSMHLFLHDVSLFCSNILC